MASIDIFRGRERRQPQLTGHRLQIKYSFERQGMRLAQIVVDVDRSASSQTAPAAGGRPEWTRLEVHQCPNCPLAVDQVSHCPAAADLAPTIGVFAQVLSHDQVQARVELPDRSVEKTCQAQDALSSLMGLMMATSACPILGRMRGLARTHLPFASHEETLLRVVGAYLIRQLLDRTDAAAPLGSLDGLHAHYADLEQLNRAFRLRLRSAARQDAAVNAVSSLGILSLGIGLSIDDALGELQGLVYQPGPPA